MLDSPKYSSQFASEKWCLEEWSQLSLESPNISRGRICNETNQHFIWANKNLLVSIKYWLFRGDP